MWWGSLESMDLLTSSHPAAKNPALRTCLKCLQICFECKYLNSKYLAICYNAMKVIPNENNLQYG